MSRQVLINSVPYEIEGDIYTSEITPWTQRLTSGEREYSDFSQASMEEWHDFRNGIGLESALPDESARMWWGEQVDVSNARGAVLSPLVTTAGTFGAAAIKIIDFQGSTYAIANDKIAVWNTTSSDWDTISDATSPTIEDCEDAWNESVAGTVTSTLDTSDYVVGSGSAKLVCVKAVTNTILATEAISSADLTSKTKIRLRIKSSAYIGGGNLKLLLDDTASCASPLETLTIPGVIKDTWTTVQMTLANPASDGAIISIGLKWTGTLSLTGTIRIDEVEALGTGGVLPNPVDMVTHRDATGEYLVISGAGSAIYSIDGTEWTDLVGCRGYMASFDNYLFSIDTNGTTVRYSAVNDIDGTWSTFSLSEDLGTVHNLFHGKLLSTDAPGLFASTTKGLWSIDFTNTKVYPYYVAYTPLDNAGRASMYFNGNLYVSTGPGIIKIGENIATPVGPDLDSGLPTGFRGDIYDMTSAGNWIVYCVNGGTTDKSSIFKRSSSIGGNLQVYSTAAANNAIACIHHSPSSLYTNGRLWFGEGTAVKYMMMPDTTPNPKQVSTYEYATTSVKLITPAFRRLAAVKKVALGLAAVTKSCDANSYITAYYRTDAYVHNAVASNWTTLGTFKTSPRPTLLTFGSDLGLDFYVIQFAVMLQRITTGTTPELYSPELESLMFYWYPFVTPLSRWTFNIRCNGMYAQKDIDAIRAIRNTSTLVPFNPTGDSAKTDYSVNIKMTNLVERIHSAQGGQIEGTLQVTCEQVFIG